MYFIFLRYNIKQITRLSFKFFVSKRLLNIIKIIEEKVGMYKFLEGKA